MKNKFTAVSCFYDIGRSNFPLFHKRTTETYIQYIKNVFKINVNLIVFTEPELVPTLSFYRKSSLTLTKDNENTVFIPLKFSELPMYKYSSLISSIHNKLDKTKCPDPIAPEVISPEYNILVNSKIGLMKKAIELNPFNSEYFGWLDAGYGHNKVDYSNMEWFPESLFIKNKLSISQLRDIKLMKESHIDFYYQHVDIVSSASFVGHYRFLLMFEGMYDVFYKKILDEGISDDEQYILALLIRYHPNLFNLFDCDWFGLINIK